VTSLQAQALGGLAPRALPKGWDLRSAVSRAPLPFCAKAEIDLWRDGVYGIAGDDKLYRLNGQRACWMTFAQYQQQGMPAPNTLDAATGARFKTFYTPDTFCTDDEAKGFAPGYYQMVGGDGRILRLHERGRACWITAPQAAMLAGLPHPTPLDVATTGAIFQAAYHSPESFCTLPELGL
jgi:hypothetical protein